jgi:hypothetical protein
MVSNQVNNKKPGFLLFLYQNLIHLMGEKRYYPEIQNTESTLQSGITNHDQLPSNRLVLKAILKIFGTVINRIYQKLFWFEQWFLIFNLDEISSNLFYKFKQITPPSDRFWADPHIIQKDNIYYVFIEEFIYHKRKGCISVLQIDDLGNYKNPIPVLEKEYHLSYPFVFSYAGKYYMVPESADNKTVQLYECAEFPYRWRFVMNLLNNVIAVDTTLLYYANQWWLFTAMPGRLESLPKVSLYLFYSKRLLTDQWNPHPLTPIISDFSSARPAGKIFTIDGKIYRPSQDISKSYGNGIFINEITRLSEDEYKECKMNLIEPIWDKKIKGTHTYSREGRLIVLDVYRKLPKITIKH